MAQLSIFSEDDPEDEAIEYKTASHGRMPDDIWEPITAFSNAEGGKIVFGIMPDGKRAPIAPSELDLLQRNLLSDCTGAYNIKVTPELNVSNGALTAYVPPAPVAVRPVHSKKRGVTKGAKVRVGPANVQVDEEWLKRFAIAAEGGAELMTYKVDYAEVLDMEAVASYIAKINQRRGGVYSNHSQDEIIRKLRIVDNNSKVTLFGLLAFSKDANLQDIVSPTLTIVVTQYPGATKVSGSGEETYIDNKEFYGPVAKQYEEALTFVLSKVPIRGVLKGSSGLRHDQYLIPYKAVREALANTLAHRDYSVHSSRIQIDIYADRIEFINPGRSLVPIAELETAPSMTRNPLLMNHLREIGATEQLARGIRTIKYELREAGLQEPTFANVNTSFVATIYHSAFIPRGDREWLGAFRGHALNERQRAGLAALKSQLDNGMSNSEYRKVNGMSKMGDDKRANKDLRKMVDVGILRKVGENRATRYFIVDDYLVS